MHFRQVSDPSFQRLLLHHWKLITVDFPDILVVFHVRIEILLVEPLVLQILQPYVLGVHFVVGLINFLLSQECDQVVGLSFILFVIIKSCMPTVLLVWLSECLLFVAELDHGISFLKVDRKV
jgi:hypothetical protein